MVNEGLFLTIFKNSGKCRSLKSNQNKEMKISDSVLLSHINLSHLPVGRNLTSLSELSLTMYIVPNKQVASSQNKNHLKRFALAKTCTRIQACILPHYFQI